MCKVCSVISQNGHRAPGEAHRMQTAMLCGKSDAE